MRPIAFGTFVRMRRRSLDRTQADLARQVYCTVSMIRKIETGVRRPSSDLADLLAGALHIPDHARVPFMTASQTHRPLVVEIETTLHLHLEEHI